MTEGIRYHTDLDVWKVSKELAIRTYRVTERFPERERFLLSDQIRRSACSVPANIAEGCGRGSSRELIRFLRVARGSLSELHSHLSLAAELCFLSASEHATLERDVRRIHQMLNAFIGSVRRRRVG